jgi:glycosyltransferase involved in cell wall biosynthesis
LVVVEAAARGVPVIAAAIGGLPEYVAAPSRPLLFRAGDETDLRSRMRAFAQRGASVADTVDHLPTWVDHGAAVLSAYAEAGARDTRPRATA